MSTLLGIGTASSNGDGGPASSAAIDLPLQIWVDSNDANLYVTDYSDNQVRKVDISTGIVTVFAGQVGCSLDCIDGPTGVVGDVNGDM
jgi:DNA-binding beta-propeller fold protein YncE